MKHKLSFVFMSFFLFSYATVFAQKTEAITEYNGLYEGEVSIYKDKKMARLYIYRYSYAEPSIGQLMRDKTTNLPVYPQPVVGKFEIYDNKKGKGIPKTTFFTALSFDIGTELVLSSFSTYNLEKDGGITKNRYSYNIKKFSIAKPTSTSQNIKVFDRHDGIFSKTKAYTALPEQISMFFNAALDDFANDKYNRYKGSLKIGSNGDKGFLTIVAKEYLNVGDTLHANIYSSMYGKEMADLKKNPSTSKLIEFERHVYIALKNKALGAHNVLKFLPQVEYIKLYIQNSDSSSEMTNKNYIYLVKVRKRENYDISYEIIDYPLKDEHNALIAEENYQNSIIGEKNRIEEERLNAEREKEKKLKAIANEEANKKYLIAQEEKRQKKLKELGDWRNKNTANSKPGVLSYTDEFWVKNFGNRISSKELMYIFEGHFDLIPRKEINWIVFYYIVSKSQNCKKSIVDGKPVSILSQDYSDGPAADEWGDMFYKEYLVVDSILYDDFNALYNSNYRMNYRKIIHLYYKFESFFEIFECDSNESKQLFENIVRLKSGEPSIQKEK